MWVTKLCSKTLFLHDPQTVVMRLERELDTLAKYSLSISIGISTESSIKWFIPSMPSKLGQVVAQLLECLFINLLAYACGFKTCHCHFVFSGKTLNCQWAEEFHQYFIAIYVCGFDQYTFTGICGMLPDQLFSVDFLWVLCFPPTAIRQIVKGLWDWIRQGSSTLEMDIKH